MRAAKLRHGGAVPEDVDYKTRRGLDKALFQQMLTGRCAGFTNYRTVISVIRGQPFH